MKNWQKHSFEFLSIFIAVISAFTLNNWNDNRKNRNAENKIIQEIYSGLEKDLIDLNENMKGHEAGINTIKYFKDIVANKPVPADSFLIHYFRLTRDFISIQNTSGYETLKSRGLELIKDDELRSKIVSLYEYDYKNLRKLEEEYFENQFQQNYFIEINKIISKNFVLDENKNITSISLPLKLNLEEERILLAYLWKIQSNRNFTLQYYLQTNEKIKSLMEEIALR